MKLYSSIFAYLNQREVRVDHLFEAKDRPYFVLEPGDILSICPMLIDQTNQVYEIGFPWLNPTYLQHDNDQLDYQLTLEINLHLDVLKIRCEVLDSATIEDDKQLEEWKEKLGDRLDDQVAQLLQILTGLCEKIFAEKVGKNQKVRVLELPEKFQQFQTCDATKPLIIALLNKYNLDKNLQIIGPKLRQQLRRKAELMPVGNIQEMDAYCLRDYTRRPGLTAAEKAGSRQELMGIKRHQDYNTPENKLLVYFAGKVLYRESNLYKMYPECEKFYKTIKQFIQQPTVQPILKTLHRFKPGKPNYVLLQNPIYHSFYQAYLDYMAKRSEKEKLWTVRNQLLKDVIYLAFTTTFLRFKDSYVEPLSYLTGFPSPKQGQYLNHDHQVFPTIRVFLRDKVYVFQLQKCRNIKLGDYLMTVEIHDLNTSNIEVQKLLFPIWIFWYLPSNETLKQAISYINNNKLSNIESGIIFFLHSPPNSASQKGKIQPISNQKIWVCQIPDPMSDNGFEKTLYLISILIKDKLLNHDQ
jgi:Transcription-repair coupling factor (superfamily II helicase)